LINQWKIVRALFNLMGEKLARWIEPDSQASLTSEYETIHSFIDFPVKIISEMTFFIPFL
jgi:hypothetical protein